MLPPKLKRGDKIGIAAFAKKISFAEIQNAISVFKSWGLEVVVGQTIGADWNQFGGNDEMRKNDVQSMIDDREIKAVISARGGYGSVRIIDDLDFSIFKQHPKWIIGFSDVTTFHSHIHHNMGIPTLHATMPVFCTNNSEESISSLKSILFDEVMEYTETATNVNLCKSGTANAEIVGGNLSILYSHCGSNSSINTDEKILFLEDLCEYLYATDRMLQNLKRNNYFENLAGVIIGSFSDMKDGSVPFGKSVEEMIFDYVKHLDIPVFTGFPAGHINNNKALIFGEKVEMVVDNNILNLNLKKS
jgi:muramoyltetrapeptide carboxypeptidase